MKNDSFLIYGVMLAIMKDIMVSWEIKCLEVALVNDEIPFY